MLIRCYWPSCDFHWERDQRPPRNALWVEATRDEAVASVFPFLNPKERAESEGFAADGERIAGVIAKLSRPFCFLVADDLSLVKPFFVHYPFGNLWNGYSPFRKLPEREIDSLDELRDLEVTPPCDGDCS